MPALRMEIKGQPVPQGSMVCLGKVGVRRHQLRHSNDRALQEYRARIRRGVASAVTHPSMSGRFPLDQPVYLHVIFGLARPKRPRFKNLPATKPDLDKLTRAVNDAITGEGLLLAEDSRVVRLISEKFYVKDGAEPTTFIVLEWEKKK